MEFQASRVILLSSRFLKKGKYWVHPILKYREDGEFLSLLRSSGINMGDSKVYFRMLVAQFDALLVPHIKKKTTHFCELSVQGSIYSALCCEISG